MFQDCERVQYKNPQLLEVICQLRFPTILSITAKEPVDFQELIRKKFPSYQKNVMKQPPKVSKGPSGVKVEEQPDEISYRFVSADAQWKVALGNCAISLSTHAYRTWEDFAGKLDEILAQFIKVYDPAFFERIGLRYINAVSRNNLQLDVPFSDLIQPAYLGLMAEDDIHEGAFMSYSQNVQTKLPGGCQLKLQTATGMIKGPNIDDKEPKFILDIDVFMAGRVEMKHSAAALNTAHINANRVFRGAITPMLHNAMEPM